MREGWQWGLDLLDQGSDSPMVPCAVHVQVELSTSSIKRFAFSGSLDSFVFVFFVAVCTCMGACDGLLDWQLAHGLLGQVSGIMLVYVGTCLVSSVGLSQSCRRLSF